MLIFAILGLFISSFALIVLQGTMGGLQNGLVSRSQRVLGQATVELPWTNSERYEAMSSFLVGKGLVAMKEVELEVLVRRGNYISPLIIHGLRPEESSKKLGHLFDPEMLSEGVVLASDVASKLSAQFSSRIQMISPSTLDPLLGDLPRFQSINISDIIMTRVPEIDSLHGWTRITFLQNLVRKRQFNRIRIWGTTDWARLDQDFRRKFGQDAAVVSWEKQNQALVWALGLETKVMLLLFFCMTMLVALSILAGFLLFFERVKTDLISFWILGTSLRFIEKRIVVFLFLCNVLVSGLGVTIGLAFLKVLERFGGNIMPAVFVERGIPILITTNSLLISFFIPFTVFALFTQFALVRFKKENDQGQFLNVIRTTG